MAEQVKVLIVDDSAFVRRAVERMLEDAPEIQVVGSATNGAEAVARAKELKPDVVVLDVNMPRLDGLQALERIMAESPTGVLMLSTLTREGAQTTLRALELGAIDFLDKAPAGTAMDIYEIAPALREKVLAVAGASIRAPTADREAPPVVEPPRPPAAPPCRYEVVVIGASTGGPRALADLLWRLPAEFPAGIVVAQHMPSGFTETLANRLDRRCNLEVVEAHDMARVEPGQVLLAPGGRQSWLERRGADLVVRVGAGPADLLHRPSVNLLFGSAAREVGAAAIGVVLTGMGDDGADGLRQLKEAGARTFAESEQSAVIFGMPRAASASAERMLPLDALARVLVETTDEGRARPEGR